MLSVENLSYTYPGGTEAVRGIDFTIEKGEIFGFLGPSGAGKSTTQKVLIRLLRGFQGQITVLGRPLIEWDDSYYEQVGVAFELPNHYQKLTARENLSLFRTLYSGDTRDPIELLEMVGLKVDADTRLSQFSKGMQMRLNFVRALIHKPDLLFLDEPTTGLDPVNGQKIKEIIRDQKAAGRTIFLTTHDMTVADQICDRVAFIIDGKITLIDSPRNLRLATWQASRQGRISQRWRIFTVPAGRVPIGWLGRKQRFPQTPAQQSHRDNPHPGGNPRGYLYRDHG